LEQIELPPVRILKDYDERAVVIVIVVRVIVSIAVAVIIIAGSTTAHAIIVAGRVALAFYARLPFSTFNWVVAAESRCRVARIGCACVPIVAGVRIAAQPIDTGFGSAEITVVTVVIHCAGESTCSTDAGFAISTGRTPQDATARVWVTELDGARVAVVAGVLVLADTVETRVCRTQIAIIAFGAVEAGK
jgi:hypothetical protein